MTKAECIESGKEARRAGIALLDNPFRYHDVGYPFWNHGWMQEDNTIRFRHDWLEIEV